jgi:hypothetical protein
MTSITKAIKEARENVALVRFGNQWQVNTYSESHRGWWQGSPTSYAQARKWASEAIVQFALEELGYSKEDARGLSSTSAYGTIRERIKRALEDYPLTGVAVYV